MNREGTWLATSYVTHVDHDYVGPKVPLPWSGNMMGYDDERERYVLSSAREVEHNNGGAEKDELNEF